MQDNMRNVEIKETDASILMNLPPIHLAVLTTPGTLKQKSEALNIPIGTVKSRQHRARKRLLEQRGEE